MTHLGTAKDWLSVASGPGQPIGGPRLKLDEAFSPRRYLAVAILLALILAGISFAARSLFLEPSAGRLYWVPTAFLVAALLVLGLGLVTNKFGGRREGAIEFAQFRLPQRFERLRSNYYLVMVAAYLAVLFFAYFRFGILFQFTLGLYALMTLPLILLASRQKLAFVKSWTPFIIVILLYEALQGVISAAVSQSGVISLYPLDSLIWGFNLTGAIQAALLSPSLTALMIFLYSMDPLLVVLASLYFWHSDKSVYGRYVFAVAITSYSALITFLFFPTAPPWYEGVAHNLLQGAGAMAQVYSNFTNMVQINKFAAFPSLHAAYAIVFLYYMQRKGTRYGLVALPITAGMLLSTIYLGQHYVIDLVGGAAYCLTACIGVDWLASRYNARSSSPTPSAPLNRPALVSSGNPSRGAGQASRRRVWRSRWLRPGEKGALSLQTVQRETGYLWSEAWQLRQRSLAVEATTVFRRCW